METIDAVKLINDTLQDKKGENIKILDIHEVSDITDYFIIVSGSNISQIQAMTDAVCEAMGREGMPDRSVEGRAGGAWVLIDFGDIIVHIFDRENREYYDIERIWRDGREVEM